MLYNVSPKLYHKRFLRYGFVLIHIELEVAIFLYIIYCTDLFLFCRDIPQIIRVGDLNLATRDDDARPEDFKVKRVIIHPDYHPPAKYHDIAIIELDRPVKSSVYVDLACPDMSRYHNETTYTISGYGKTEFAGNQIRLNKWHLVYRVAISTRKYNISSKVQN